MDIEEAKAKVRAALGSLAEVAHADGWHFEYTDRFTERGGSLVLSWKRGRASVVDPLLRLTWLLGLRPEALRFVTAAAGVAAGTAPPEEQPEILAVFSDWLADELNDDSRPGVLRRMVPCDGDLIIYRMPQGVSPHSPYLRELADRIFAAVRRLGGTTAVLIVDAGWSLEKLTGEELLAAGLLTCERAEDMRREREQEVRRAHKLKTRESRQYILDMLRGEPEGAGAGLDSDLYSLLGAMVDRLKRDKESAERNAASWYEAAVSAATHATSDRK
jgi:hypothetical protein